MAGGGTGHPKRLFGMGGGDMGTFWGDTGHPPTLMGVCVSPNSMPPPTGARLSKVYSQSTLSLSTVAADPGGTHPGGRAPRYGVGGVRGVGGC